jgi:leucyl-tRNA synthetase
MFPYPSGANLHVWHPKGYIATDTLARKKMLEWFNVLHPMGFDTFGLGTEQYAIEHKMKPQVVSQKNIETFIQQLETFGTTYDRSRSVNTADPKYFKRTQRVFLQMYNHYYDEQDKKAMPIASLKLRIENWELKINEDIEKYLNKQRLAYVDYKPINRCPSCMTGLANEDLDDGKCERCGSEVEQKPMKQRVLRITKYADRLLEWLNSLKREESMKDLERNWIGKSEWTQFAMQIVGTGNEGLGEWYSFEVYTTRIDTVFGMSFVAIAPEHPLIKKMENGELKIENWKAIEQYREQANKKTQLERTELQKDKTWVKIEWIRAINPFNGKKVPIFVADYVLANYGTGVVMAVPAHDERDFEFAKKYDLPITNSILPKDKNYENYTGILSSTICFTEKWLVNNSWDFTWLTSDEAITAMQVRLEKKWIGWVKVNYKMQDRVFSRQRYRGEPFPILWIDEEWKMNNPLTTQRTSEKWKKIIPLDEKELPLLLPDVENYAPTGTEEGPLANITDWVNVTLPDGTPAKRETNTMPGRAGSSRYWLRYMDPNNTEALVGKDKEKYRGNVDVYVGGAEHICRHILYGRFWQNFLYDIWAVTKKEPFQEYHSVGLIMGEDGRKMSKRRGNVVNPDDIINEFGADVLRAYEMFMGPFDQSIARSTNGIKGIKKFLDKIILLKDKISDTEETNETKTILNQSIKKLTEDIDGFRFNTAISQLMILVNHLTECTTITKKTFEDLVILVSPFAPHLAEDLWEQLGNEYSIFTKATWPKYDEIYLVADTVTIAVQVNGKVRWTLSISKEVEEDEVMKLAKADPKIAARIVNEPKKVIYVKGKILNIVV